MIGNDARNGFERMREGILDDFLSRHFLFGGFISSDTYKRTMWQALHEVAAEWAAYHLTLRKGLNEPGTENQLIMAGHEWVLSQWFREPLKRSKIELAIEWYTKHSNVKAFPTAIFEQLLNDQSGEDIHLPIDVWGFPGGQIFLAGVPAVSFEGVGGLVSFLEPHKCRYFAPIIQATKARLMFEAAGPTHAEFGYRSDINELASLAKMFALYIGNGDNPVLTSCDIAEFLFPDLFKAIGTTGHEAVSTAQSLDKELDEAELEVMNLLVERMAGVKLLPDLIDPLTVGLENMLTVLRNHPEKTDIGPRIDSGHIEEQCVLYHDRMVGDPRIGARKIVYEDEVTPVRVREVSGYFERETNVSGREILIPGAGGYYNRDVHRDTVSAAFKRAMTGKNPNIKFSGSPGKESDPGCIRVYGRGDTLIKAHVTEEIDGEPLYVKLVEQGRYCYQEHMQLRTQAQRANRTWGTYKKVERSPLLQEWHERFVQKRRDAQRRAVKNV
jgi:nicotinate phosphoribosyltransferase